MNTRLLLVIAVASACKTAPEPVPERSSAPAAEAPAQRVEKALEPPTLRLPEGVVPTQQALELRIVPGDEKFSGVATIGLELAQPQDVVWLNGTDLEVLAASFDGVKARAKVVTDQLLAIIPAAPLAKGPATLKLEYRGTLSKKNNGGLFQLREGDQWYAYTHFEPLDARRAFPCFDEPNYKIPWQVTVRHDAKHVALANTPVEETRDDKGERVTRFATTKPLPSYLVAVAVGPFDIVDAGRFGKNKVPVRIVGPKGKAAEMAYSAESTGPILEQLEAYFGIPYPYEKLDSIALPINTGAMENPGLVTYGHQLLLARPVDDTLGRQRTYALVCAHELAHQWFGDLVTMAWWNDLWLNEAFATWMSSKLMLTWKPKWDYDVANVQRRGAALYTDGLVNARRIRQPIETNDDIANAFDGITYGKGASVIAMFESWVSPEQFQRGVHRYLEEHAHKNATAADFLAAISKESGKDVATAFNTFLDQPGAPRVAMELKCAKGAVPVLELSQRRQLPIGSTGDARKVWSLPVCVRWSTKGREERACTLLDAAQGQLQLGTAKVCPDWVLPNDKMNGYYRASLSGAASLPALLAKASKALSIPERVGVMGDMSALVGSGELDLTEALKVVPLSATESNRHLVSAAMSLAAALDDVVVPAELTAKAEAFIRRHFSARASGLGLTVAASEDEDVRLLRPGLVGLVARRGKEPKLRKQALELAARWLGDRRAIHADMVDTVLAIAADTGDPALHAAFLEAVTTEKDRADRNHMLVALASFREAGLVKRQLSLALGNELDARESMRLVWGAAQDFRTRDLAYEFVKQNWDALIGRLPKDSGSGLVFVAGGYCEEKPKADARAFFDGRSTRYLGGPRNFALAFEEIDLCMAYRARQRPVVTAFLQSLSL